MTEALAEVSREALPWREGLFPVRTAQLCMVRVRPVLGVRGVPGHGDPGNPVLDLGLLSSVSYWSTGLGLGLRPRPQPVYIYSDTVSPTRSPK